MTILYFFYFDDIGLTPVATCFCRFAAGATHILQKAYAKIWLRIGKAKNQALLCNNLYLTVY